MKTFSTAALDALERGDAIVSGSVEIYGTPPIFLFGGHGSMVLPADGGTATFEGLGARALIRASGGSVGGSADNISLVLSGVAPEAIEILDATEVKGAAVVVRRLIFDNSGKTLLGSYVFTRGKLDQLSVNETIGDEAAIEATIESAARGLGRSGGRTRSDADQRLINATDGFFKTVSYAGQKTLYWGGKRPATLGGTYNLPIQYCVTEDSLVLMANGTHDGPGPAKPAGEVGIAEWVWTRHETSLEWGAFPVVGANLVQAPVMSRRGWPSATPLHRFALPLWLMRRLPPRLRWFRMRLIGRPAGIAKVARLTVDLAATLVARHPAPGSPWRLSHNIKMNDPIGDDDRAL